MLSIFNVMAAQWYRLRVGFWPLFLTVATVVSAAVGAWSQHLSYVGGGLNEDAVSLLPWAGMLSLILGVMICHALLRSLMSQADSNFLRSREDRLVYSASHVLVSLIITAAAVCLSLITELAMRVLLGLPAATMELPAMLAWAAQMVLAIWSVCLAGLCIGCMTRSSGVATVVMALVTLGVPGSILALPFMASRLWTAVSWFAANQPSAWISSLVQNTLLDSVALALLAASCIVLIVLLLIVSVHRKLK